MERHTVPERLIRQITIEAINALELGGAEKIGDAAPLEAGVDLIAKAWALPGETRQANMDLIQTEKRRILSGAGKAVLPGGELLQPYDGRMIAALLWGLFETAVRLEEARDRAAMYELALLMAESLDLDSWIAENLPADTDE